MVDQSNIDYSAELIRKGIHLCSLSIPVIYYYITRDRALAILVPLTLAFLAVDLLRYYHAPTSALFYRVFRGMLRSHEQDHQAKRLNGATHVLISATICVIVFPKIITVTAFAVLILSDSSAALVGRRFGRRRFLSKSLEGSAAFFVAALAVIALTPKVYGNGGEYIIAVFAAALGTAVEALSIKIDDNLSIPLSIGAAMWILYAVFYPWIDLSAVALPR